MLTIWKFPVPLGDYPTIEMPKGAQVLHFDMQNRLTIWALVDPSAPKEERHFRLAGTGHPINSDGFLIHLGTCFQGPFVWHLFE